MVSEPLTATPRLSVGLELVNGLRMTTSSFATSSKDNMTTKRKPMTKEPVAQCPPPPELEKDNPSLSHLVGSKYDDWNSLVANQAMNSARYPSKIDAEQRKKMQFGISCS
jgi:hypothetical protein